MPIIDSRKSRRSTVRPVRGRAARDGRLPVFYPATPLELAGQSESKDHLTGAQRPVTPRR